MKIVRILTVSYIQAAVDAVLPTLPDDASYETILETFRKKRILHPNFFPEAMATFGFEVFDFVIDCPALTRFFGKTPLEALAHFIRYHSPDILYYERSAISKVPEKWKYTFNSSVRMSAGYWGAQLNADYDRRLFRPLTHMFTIDRSLGKLIGDATTTTVLRSSFDGKDIPFLPFKKRSIDAAFYGTSGYGYIDHQKRYLFLRQACRDNAFTLFCDTPSYPKAEYYKYALLHGLSFLPKGLLALGKAYSPLKPRAFHLALQLKKHEIAPPVYLKHIPLHQEFPERVQPALFGDLYEQALQKTKIVINTHTDSPNLGGNMRTYEATAMGALLLSDRKDVLQELFDTEKEIVTYETYDEAIDTIRYFTAHPEEAEKIARAGQEKTLSTHTLFHRAKVIADVLLGHTSKKTSQEHAFETVSQ